MSGEFVARMEALLDLYSEERDSERPVVCFDETSKQLMEEAREPIGAEPGRLERYDYEYKRKGTRNLFVFCEPKSLPLRRQGVDGDTWRLRSGALLWTSRIR